MRSALASFLSVAARCSDRPVAASANLPGAAGIALSILALFATDPLFAPSHPSRVHAADARPEPDDKPLTPAQSLSLLKTPDDLRVDLIAAEPLVVSPVAMAFDEQGRLFVAENRGYPTGPKEGEPQPGRIVQLIDRDADGQYDSRLDFATELSFPNGLMPWKGGLIVTCSPDILFLEDTNNDGRADKRQVLFTGFSTQGSTQLRTSHPTLGPDGWIYTTNGLMGGQVISLQQPDQKPVSLAGQDFRFDPQSGAYEAIDGRAQFGLTFDDFGHRFICYNRVHVQHVVLSSAILRRNPFLAFSETVQNCPAEMQPEPSRGHGRSAAIFPLSQNAASRPATRCSLPCATWNTSKPCAKA